VIELGSLLAAAGIPAALTADAERLLISSVELDSRLCTEGSLFVCTPGATTTGAAFVDDAVARGARCVVSSTPVETAAAVVTVDPASLRRALADLSSAVVGDPADDLTLVGVTGTNGKTTVTWLVAGILARVGYHAAAIGTLTGLRTTPAAPELHRELRAVADGARRAGRPGGVALEVSSHALDQGRVDGVRFDVAVFTNLSHEHLDYHGTMSSYFEAKATLFELDRAAAGVVCVDDEWGRALVERGHVPTVEVATRDASDVHVGLGTTSFQWRGRAVITRLTGRVNVINALLALNAVEILGVDAADGVLALGAVEPVPGRLEPVGDDGVHVFVDYAHTPAALERVLGDLRALCPQGRLLVVFGCGGERDAAKRPLMGTTATTLADVVVVTSDNPRGEAPDRIIDEVLAGATGPADVVREADRAAAIALAIESARPGDVVLIAGKGHETTQEIAGVRHEFDDRVVATEVLAARRSSC
jgi:UDP-N-acetylmuramoyl-L-alanyl-D-glutamate--2,6-diaminopimelate ligase